MKLYKLALEKTFEDGNLDEDYSLGSKNLEYKVPIIIEGEDGILEGLNFSPEQDTNQVFLRKQIDKLLANGFVPLKGDGYAKNIYYTRTRLYRLIQYFPLVQMLLVITFVGLGYMAFGQSKRAEQNRVWAGMAKETAHQLGTPISAIMAWLENLKYTTNGNAMQDEIIQEMEDDVARLELVADRFSKIGSKPELTKTNIYHQLDLVYKYMVKRAPKRMKFYFPDKESEPLYCSINAHLFDWVLENLIGNALDAMDREGEIRIDVSSDESHVIIDVSDTGKGIPSNKFKTVFKPGYSTKARGWGLGLSLVKRIVENYHAGKIFVKKSKINEGTTFTIRLPKA